MGALVWKVMSIGAAQGVSVLVRNVIQKIWEKSTGKPPPANPASPTTAWAEAIGFALFSGALVQVGRMVAQRQAAAIYKKSAGHLPKGLEKVS